MPDIILDFRGPHGPMTSGCRATPWGFELLWGLLTEHLRAQLEHGGCPLRVFTNSIAASWEARERRGATVPLRLALEVQPGGIALRCVASRGVTMLVRADWWLAFTWEGERTRLPMKLPPFGELPDVWDLLPKRAHERLEYEGLEREGFNLDTLERARLAIAAGGVGAEVDLNLPTKRAPAGVADRKRPVSSDPIRAVGEVRPLWDT